MSLRGTGHPHPSPHHPIPPIWIDKTRQLLIKIEKDTFLARVNKWNELVNKQTLALQIDLFSHYNSAISFECILSHKDLFESTAHLVSWEGLDLNKSCRSNMPKSLQQYQAKARNWLNGLRAKKCAQTLFPLLIIKAEEVNLL